MALRQLCISEVSFPDNPPIALVLPSVTHLETLEPRAWRIMRHWDLPSLSNLRVDWYGDWNADTETDEFDPRHIHPGLLPSSIRHLSMRIDVETLPFTSFSTMIDQFPKLETFSYELDLSPERPNKSPDWIGVYHPTLQHVGIQCRNLYGPWSGGTVHRWGGLITNHIKGLVADHARLPLLTKVTLSIVWLASGHSRYKETDDEDWQPMIRNLLDGLSTARIKVTYDC